MKTQRLKRQKTYSEEIVQNCGFGETRTWCSARTNTITRNNTNNTKELVDLTML